MNIRDFLPFKMVKGTDTIYDRPLVPEAWAEYFLKIFQENMDKTE